MRTRKLGIQVLSAAALATALLFAACGQKADHKESSESSEAAARETVAERPTYSYQRRVRATGFAAFGMLRAGKLR